MSTYFDTGVLLKSYMREAACTAFVSFDERQRKIATLAGLDVLPAKLIQWKQ